MAVTTELLENHEKAIWRLAEVAGEGDGQRRVMVIFGWPAMERTYMKRLAHPQAGSDSGAIEVERPTPIVQAATAAIAQGDSIVRFQGSLPACAPMPSANDALRFRFVDCVSDRAIPNPLDHFINHVKRYEKPITWSNWLPESDFDRQIELHCAEQAMENVFEPDAVEIVKLVNRNDLHISQPDGVEGYSSVPFRGARCRDASPRCC